jgi:hypothetical protein
MPYSVSRQTGEPEDAADLTLTIRGTQCNGVQKTVAALVRRPGVSHVNLPRFAARRSGLACGLALAVRPAGSAEVSGAQGWVLKIVSAKRLETIFGCP